MFIIIIELVLLFITIVLLSFRINNFYDYFIDAKVEQLPIFQRNFKSLIPNKKNLYYY